MTATGVDPMPFTIAHFIVMGVFAVLVIAGILWGMKLKRRRRQAEQDFDAHRDAADVAVAPPAEEPEAALPATAPSPAPARDTPPLDATPLDTSPAAALGEAVAATPLPDGAPLAGDIMQLKGLGPKLAATLAGLGITRVEQIAAMTPAELDALDARLGAFQGRPARDRWAEQARLLVVGDKAAYETAFGKLGG